MSADGDDLYALAKRERVLKQHHGEALGNILFPLFVFLPLDIDGGILKMLRSEEQLSAKEYPLVLDGPFSKLDPDQRQNVVNMIPEFAPQVILFSKDDLHGVFAEENIGRVWTIVSNEDKNVARIEEGHLWK